MYRVLAAHAEVRERRDRRRHPVYAAPELLATGPKQLWSWDIIRLKGPTIGVCHDRYVVLDVFSRYVVGWMVAPRESATLAQRPLAACCTRQGIQPGHFTIHADRGASMRSKPVPLLLADLGVTKVHSRPHVSNDHRYSEAHVKTLKDRPDFPARFGALEHARAHGTDFLPWYNAAHRHVSLGLHTPHDVHHDLASARRAQRALVLTAACAATPERFVRRPPTSGDVRAAAPPRPGSTHPTVSTQRPSFSHLHPPGVAESLTDCGCCPTLAFSCRARLNDRPAAKRRGRTSAPCQQQRVVMRRLLGWRAPAPASMSTPDFRRTTRRQSGRP